MKKTAKIRFLAWLMVICLIVPELSLNAYAADNTEVAETVAEDSSLNGVSASPVAIVTSVDNDNISTTAASVTAELTSDSNFNGYVGYYIKKSADSAWTSAGSSYVESKKVELSLDGTTTYYYACTVYRTFAGLAVETAYDYKLVFADDMSSLPAVDKLAEAKEYADGKFTTLAEIAAPSLNEEKTELGRYNAKLVFDLTGVAAEEPEYANLYIEETYKGADDKDVTGYVYQQTSDNNPHYVPPVTKEVWVDGYTVDAHYAEIGEELPSKTASYETVYKHQALEYEYIAYYDEDGKWIENKEYEPGDIVEEFFSYYDTYLPKRIALDTNEYVEKYYVHGHYEYVEVEPGYYTADPEVSFNIYDLAKTGRLHANTTYKYKVAVSSNAIADDVDPAKINANIIEGTFTTAADNRTAVLMSTAVNTYKADFEYGVTGFDPELDEDSSASVVLLYREKSEANKNLWDGWSNDAGSVDYNDQTRYAKLTANGFEKGKQYEYIVGVWDYSAPENTTKDAEGKEVKLGWYFVNPAVIAPQLIADAPAAFDASVAVVAENLTPTKSILTYLVDGISAKDETEYVAVSYMLKEKADDATWNSYRTRTGSDVYGKYNVSFNTKEATTYVFRIAVSSNVIPQEELEKATTGFVDYEFTTPADDRAFTSLFVDPGYNSVYFRYEATNKFNADTLVTAFIKEVGTDEWQRFEFDLYGSAIKDTYKIYNLKNSTQYDYVLALSNGSIGLKPSDEDFAKAVVSTKKGSFCTTNAAYSVSFNKITDCVTDDKGDTTPAKFTATLKAESSKELDNVILGAVNVTKITKDKDGKPVETKWRQYKVFFLKDTNNSMTYTTEFTDSVYDSEATFRIDSVDLYINEAGNRHYVKTLTGPYGTYTYVNNYKTEVVKATSVEFFTGEVNDKGETILTAIENYYLNAGSYGETIQYATYGSYEGSDIIVKCMNGDKEATTTAVITKIEGDTAALSGAVVDRSSGTFRAKTPGTVKITFTALDSLGKDEAGNELTPVTGTLTVKVGDYRPYVIENGAEVSADPAGVDGADYNPVTINTGKTKTFVIKDFSTGTAQTASANATYAIAKTTVATNKDGGADITGVALGVTDVIATVGEGYKVLAIVKVKAAPAGFILYGVDADDYDYPAILSQVDKADVYKLCTSTKYTISLKETPDNEFGFADNRDYIFTSSDEDIATVDENGRITLKKADPLSPVTITVTAKEEGYDAVTFTIQSLAKPKIGGETLALSNLKMKTLKDVPLPDYCSEGVEWAEPNTKIEGLKSDDDGRYFVAQYTGDTFYPMTGSVLVYYDTITEFWSADSGENHAVQVMGVGGFDDCLDVFFGYNTMYNHEGTLNGAIKVSVAPVKNLTIKDKDLDGYFGVYAAKAGTYTLKATYYYEFNGIVKQIGKATYKFTAVNDVLVGNIVVKAYDANGVMIVDTTGTINSIHINNVTAGQKIDLVATAYNRIGDEIAAEDTHLIWSTNNTNVAEFDKTLKSTTNTLTSKGAGNTWLTVKADDKAGVSESIEAQFRDLAPIIEHTNVTINTAYDFNSEAGKNLALANEGYVVIAKKDAYDADNYDAIVSAVLYENGQPSKDYKLVRAGYDSKYIIVPNADVTVTNAETKTFTLKVNTKLSSAEAEVKANVIYETPAIKAKASKKVNLYYKQDWAEVTLSVKKSSLAITAAKWDPSVSGNTVSGNRFIAYTSGTDKKGNPVVALTQYNLDLTKKGKKYVLTDATVAAKPLGVKVVGYKDYILVNGGNAVKLGTMYKNGAIKAAKLTISKAVDISSGIVGLYDKYLKSYLYYASENYTTGNIAYRNVFERTDGGNNSDIVISRPNSSYDTTFGMAVYYAGEKSSAKTTVNLYSNNWADKKTVKVTVKNVKPKAYLDPSKLTYNTTLGGKVYTRVGIKGVTSRISLKDVAIKGANSKAQALLDNGALEMGIEARNNGYAISVYKNYNLEGESEKALNIKPGNYSYKVTATTSNGTVLKPVTLKVTITSKAPTVTVKISGKLDAYRMSDYHIDSDGEVSGVTVKSIKFKNTPTDFSGYIFLTGEYSEYFKIGYDSDDSKYHIAYNTGYTHNEEVLSNYSYKISVGVTGHTYANDIITVVSKPVTVKTTQKACKIKVLNAVTMYTNSKDNYRAFVQTKAGYTGDGYVYWIDVNKDDQRDMAASYEIFYDGTGYIDLYIVDENADFSKSNYVINVPVQLHGRDGITKDLNAKVKVSVK